MDHQRRKFLKTASLTIVTGAVLSYFPLHYFLSGSLDREQSFAIFKNISQILTARNDLSPQLMQEYFDFLYDNLQHNHFAELIHDIHGQRVQMKEYIQQTLKEQGTAGTMLKKILKMWYLGAYDDQTLSVAAYQNSLLWRTFASAPRGVPLGNVWQLNPYE